LSFRREKVTVCVGCGTRKDEWKENRFAFVGNAEICPGCELMEMERENIPPGTKGVKTFLVRNDPDIDLMEYE
jgi:hypothetical protein